MKTDKTKTPMDCGTLLSPGYFLFCRDVIVGTDNSASFIKVFEQISPKQYPVLLERFVLVSEFLRKENVPLEQFVAQSPLFKLVLVNPDNAEFVIGEFPVSQIKTDRPWTAERVILDLSGTIELKKPGLYFFKLYGKTATTDFVELTQRALILRPTRPLETEKEQAGPTKQPKGKSRSK
jgi:hypothetical protein